MTIKLAPQMAKYADNQASNKYPFQNSLMTHFDKF